MVVIRWQSDRRCEIMARGNVYVVGDVAYQDGSDASGAHLGPPAMEAGMPLSRRRRKYPDRRLPHAEGRRHPRPRQPGPRRWTSAYSFTMSEITLFNRGEWAKTQPLLPGPAVSWSLIPNTMPPTSRDTTNWAQRPRLHL